MNKIFNKITWMVAAGLAIVGMAACSGQDDIVDNIEYNRLFSPTELEAKVQNTTGVRLSWRILSETNDYVVEIYADDADMTFSGTPLTYTVTPEVKGDELRWTLEPGILEGETTYSVRVKANATTKAESKWAATTFETGTEQIFNAIPTTDISKTSVKLTWPAGTAVTRLSVVKSDEELASYDLRYRY